MLLNSEQISNIEFGCVISHVRSFRKGSHSQALARSVLTVISVPPQLVMPRKPFHTFLKLRNLIGVAQMVREERGNIFLDAGSATA